MSIPASSVPDFRNQGVWLRLLLACNGVMVALALARNRAWPNLPGEIAELALFFEPALLATLVALYWLAPWLRRQPLAHAHLYVTLLAAVIASGFDVFFSQMMRESASWRVPVAAASIAAGLFHWLVLRGRAQTPALAEARLAALTARIRPHFLFNSLNAVLGVMRDDPRRAEAALEALCELFRALMREQRELVLLSDEIALARKYLEIEKLRLGERLAVRWTIADCPPDLLAPPLLLQPLLENAVYHGIEPAQQPEEIRVRISANRGGVDIEIDNPCAANGGQRTGNRLALDNLRERLMLFYDLEAHLETGERAGRYWVRVHLPHRSRS